MLSSKPFEWVPLYQEKNKHSGKGEMNGYMIDWIGNSGMPKIIHGYLSGGTIDFDEFNQLKKKYKTPNELTLDQELNGN